MKYYNLENGLLVENENGLLPGIEWQVGSNTFRAIMTVPNFTDLMHGQRITFTYTVHIQPSGMTDWIFVRNETIIISNQNYINTSTLDLAPMSEAIDEGGFLKSGYSKELDYYIGMIGKGIYQPIVPIYDWIIPAVTRKENIPQS